jgi:thymidylate synthase (FAD)
MIKTKTYSVLDHGFVRFIEAWGRGEGKFPDYERGIIEAARQSTQGSFRGWRQDKRLLRTLYTHKHSTPFEFAGMIIEVRAPIFVVREWHRHRTQAYNEMSARYAPLPELRYFPTLDRLMQVNQRDANKQAGNIGGMELSPADAMLWFDKLEHAYVAANDAYQFGLSIGVAKELARLPMPVGHYTQMRCQASLRNWLAFLTLRMDPRAQWEIRQYANAVGSLISQTFPQTWKLFTEAM